MLHVAGSYVGDVTVYYYTSTGTLDFSNDIATSYTCSDIHNGMDEIVDEWTTNNLDDGVSVCVYSSELGILQFAAFNTDGSSVSGKTDQILFLKRQIPANMRQLFIILF